MTLLRGKCSSGRWVFGLEIDREGVSLNAFSFYLEWRW